MCAEDYSEWGERLAGCIRREELYREVTDWLSEGNGSVGSWGVACSGGADSVCLLLVLYAYFPEARERLKVLHFNHCLRGAASDGDAVFVRRLAEGLGCRVRVGRARFSSRGGSRRIGFPRSEAELRSERFRFFENQLKGGSVLFLGHHRDDVAETMLMRLARGSGSGGLAAPRPVHTPARGGPTRLRPLLGLSRDRITEALRESGVPWREDATNATDRYFRNRLRRRVLPVWRAASPMDPVVGAARSRRLIEEDERALVCWLNDLMPAPCRGRELDLKRLVGKPRALFRRALHGWLVVQGDGGSEGMNAAAFEVLLEAAVAGRDFQMSYGKERFLKIDGGVLSVRVPLSALEWAPFGLPQEGSAYLPDGAVLCCERVVLNDALRREIGGGAFDPQCQVFFSVEHCVSYGLVSKGYGWGWLVRCWRNGDRYRPLGAPGVAKLQDVFTNRKVPVDRRRRLPVVCMPDGTIVWCPGLPPAGSFRISACTEQAFRLAYRTGSSE